MPHSAHFRSCGPDLVQLKFRLARDHTLCLPCLSAVMPESFIIIIIIISIFRFRCCPCPILLGWQHNALSDTSSPSISVLWANTNQATLVDISLYTFRVFLGLPCFLKLGIVKFVIDLIHDSAHLTWPYHLIRRQQRTDVISFMPSFWRSEAEDTPSQCFTSQIQRIIELSLRQRRFTVLVPTFRYHGA